MLQTEIAIISRPGKKKKQMWKSGTAAATASSLSWVLRIFIVFGLDVAIFFFSSLVECFTDKQVREL